MSPEFNPLYSPYGAYELKASYQRNMMLSSMYVFGFVIFLTILGIIFINSPAKKIIDDGIPPIDISKSLPHPPSVAPSTPQLQIKPPRTDLPRFTQMIPVDDELIIEIESDVISIDEFAGGSDNEEIRWRGRQFGTGNSESDGDMPGLNQFVYVEQIPQFIYRAKPEYPRFERQLGIEGTVWIAVAVDIDGSVANARVYKSSGRESFDKAALTVAYDNKFRPAIQNGNPIKIWISYQVEFVLTD